MTQIADTVRFLGRHDIQDFCRIGVDGPPSSSTVFGDDAVVRSHSVVYAGNKIGAGFRTGHGALIRENNRIGDRVSVGSHTIIERDNIIEEGVRIHSHCFIPEFITIRQDAWIGPRVTILNAMHPPCPEFEKCGQGIAAEGHEDARIHGVEIGPRAVLGGNVTIGPWVRIGEGALVGAGSVVTRDVAPGSVVTGNPAKQRSRVADLACQAGYFKTPYEWDARP